MADNISYRVIAIDDEENKYPDEVEFVIRQSKKKDYIKAAEYLSMSDSDIICVQHEYGIFGGNRGAFLEETISSLKKPVVLTMHTVIKQPDEEMRIRTRTLAAMCQAIVVLSSRAKQFLIDAYHVPEEKIHVIYHGVPDVPFIDPNYYKDKFNVEGKVVLLTFGLISENKGIETVLKALPSVIKMHPEVRYIVQGITHPNIVRERGEEYRFRLKHLVKVLNLEKNVIFINRYLKLQELNELIGASDIYITPYKNKEQISSGTLAYAVGAGKAVISTPYYCAEEFLSNGKGLLFGFNDSEALANTLLKILSDQKTLHRMRKRAYVFGRTMVWSEVGKQYVELFTKVKKKYIPVEKEKIMRREIYEDLPDISFIHLKRLTDDVGLMQHSIYSLPDRRHGYSSDDAARALLIVINQFKQTNDESLLELARRYLSFLYHAQRDDGLFHNFMSYERKWIDEVGGEDTQGRAMWGLGYTFFSDVTVTVSRLAKGMFDKVIENAKFSSQQAKAYAICGCYYYLKKFSGATNIKRMMEKYSDELVAQYRTNSKKNWNWFEDRITYGRAKICHALLLAYQMLGKDDYRQIALESLDFLSSICIKDGMLSVIGNKGWYGNGAAKPAFDQQPIDAWYFAEAFRCAYEVAGDDKYEDSMYICLEWFLGNNILQTSLGNTSSGSCMDGISHDGLNLNKGAESTLAFLGALQTVSDFEVDQELV